MGPRLFSRGSAGWNGSSKSVSPQATGYVLMANFDEQEDLVVHSRKTVQR
jgi:hypothetical protein